MDLQKGFYQSPRWSYEILDCNMPMSFDTYSNCAFQCVYCFSFFQRAVGEGANDYLSHKVKSVNVEAVKRMFTDPDQYGGQFAPYIKQRRTMQWGGLSDGFDWYERKFGKSLELLKFFVEIDYPISISTKGVWFLDDPRYREVLQDAKNTHWKISIITLDEEDAKRLERGVVSPYERMEGLAKLNELGVGATTLRFRPFIIGTSDKHIDKMMKLASEAGVYSTTTEFLCWESRASKNSRSRLESMTKTLGYDVWKFYRENSDNLSGLMRLNYDIKRKYIDEIRTAAHKYGLKFMVSDAHHKGAGDTSSCCGLPPDGPLSNVNRGQYSAAIQIAKKNKKVHWSDIAEEAAILKTIPFVGAVGFPGSTKARVKRKYQTMFDYMRDVWNNPKSTQSPARYFGGVLVPSGIDENGDIIYLYNQPFVLNAEEIKSAAELAEKLGLAGSGRAKRIDDATQDGAQFGHVEYPIVIPTKGRWNKATTPKILAEVKLNFTFAVIPSEHEEYLKRFPNADYLVLPSDNMGIDRSREYIHQHYSKQGYERIWMIDDDVSGFDEYDTNGKGKKVGARAALSYVEGLVAKYKNVAIAALDYTQFAWASVEKKPYTVNTRVWVCALINLQTGITYSETVQPREDVEFLLRHLSTGYWTSVLVHKFAMRTVAAGKMSGGCTPYYLKKEHIAQAERLHKLYPNVTRMIDKKPPFDKDVQIIWKKFTQPLLPNIEGVMSINPDTIGAEE